VRIKYEVLIQPPALEDIEGAYHWLATQTPTKAAEWYNGLVETILSLERNPERCATAPESSKFKDDLHTDYVPAGHSTSLAARMESLAGTGTIVVSKHTHRRTEGYFRSTAPPDELS